MAERPVRLFLPPEAPPHVEIKPPPLPAIPQRLCSDLELHAGIAVMGHAGRITDKVLMTVLRWTPGTRLSLDVSDDAITLTGSDDGASEVDQRSQVIIPSQVRGRAGIATGDRVLLVAVPTQNALILHPMSVLVGLLADHYQSRGDPGDDD